MAKRLLLMENSYLKSKHRRNLFMVTFEGKNAIFKKELGMENPDLHYVYSTICAHTGKCSHACIEAHIRSYICRRDQASIFFTKPSLLIILGSYISIYRICIS